MITTIYLVFVKNDEIFGIQVENGYLYNRVHIKHVETLEGNHSRGFKIVLVNFGARKFIVVNPDVKVLVNLISITSFHSVVTIEIIPLDPRGDPLEIMKKSCPLQLDYLVVT
jgi:hypothetical protein